LNRAALDAFVLAIVAGEGWPAFPAMPGPGPDLAKARRDAGAIHNAMAAIRSVVVDPGSYVAESDFFEQDWQRAHWGPNYPRLEAVKRKYDLEGLFFVRRGVGSDAWSTDGFTRSSRRS
jgi:hypothetical protein